MNTRRTVEVVLLVALVATAAFTVRNAVCLERSPLVAELAGQKKVVQRVVRQAEDSRLPAILIKVPVSVWLFLFQD